MLANTIFILQEKGGLLLSQPASFMRCLPMANLMLMTRFKVQRKLNIMMLRKRLGGSLVVHGGGNRRGLSTVSGASLTLWHSPDARSLRCLWTLEEIGVPDYTLITMPFPPRFFHRDFLKINVLGTIPFLKDGDNAMTESCASE